MIVMLEITVLLMLAAVVLRGLWIWHLHRVVVSQFDGRDFWAALSLKMSNDKEERTHTWVARNFILIAFSVFLGCADFALRLNWALQYKWDVSGNLWAYAWLLFHVGLCLLFLKVQHVAHAALLSIEDWDGIRSE